MTCFQGIGLTFTVLMIFGTVKARWLDLESHPTLSTSSSMISDGIDHDYMNQNNPRDYLRMGGSDASVSAKTFYGEKRCESIYGVLPCADTMVEGVFLMILYTHLMMLGEEWIHKGSEALFLLLGDYKVIGSSLFRVLMAFPRIVIVIVAGMFSTESAAQSQVAFGVRMYAGSTLITLTFIWGLRIILNCDKLRGMEPILVHEQQEEDSSTKCLPLKHKLSILNDDGVNVDKETGNMAQIMLLSLTPFAIVELVALIKSPYMTLFALIVSCVSLALYFALQISHPWIQLRCLVYLKKENLRIRFFYHIQRLAEANLIDEHGNPNSEAFKSIFERADVDKDGCISKDELEHLVGDVFELEEDHISIEYAKAEILTHFDDDKNGLINRLEFQKGCAKWFKKWKNDANNSSSFFKNLWKQVEKVAIRNKRENLTQIDIIMPRIMRQVLKKHDLVKENGDAHREKIEELFSQYDHDRDDEVHQSEIEEFIETLHFGVSLDHDTIFDVLEKDFDNDGNHDTMKKSEFVEGFIKWIDIAITHDPSIIDPKLAIAKFEEDSWAEIDTPMNTVKPKASIVYVIAGILVMFAISRAFMQSVLQFSNAAQVPFHLTSFVVFPIAMNGRMLLTSLLHTRPHVSKNASLTFSEMYNGLVMNNLLGLLTLLAIVYAKELSWTYSTEVLTIMIPCAVVGFFARKRDTYPLWASITAMLLYPIYAFVYCVFGS
ncbi:hypothetical protein SSX86_023545 [Deinandra increscens subsp. villosa]|uniref:EF-hand domain-containing protein n=1 Tax=Deinandra increscens subsp. villosa TaxID=3103831 RepID=A0AAP0CSR0_9ASTR